MRLGISVVVCTYNGSTLLPDTIRHIALQRVDANINWEVIVVDNASTDDSSLVAAAEWEKYQNSTNFKVLHQPKQGLTYARELALEKAKYEFVLFCDDDNWLNPNYVNLSYNIMLENPSIGVLGGLGELDFEIEPPMWAVGLSSFASGPQAMVSGKVKHNTVYGAGFIIRNTAFKTISKAGFRTMLTDRVANNLSAGGDLELCYAIALAKFDIWYDERLKFKHFMPKNRINWDYCVRLYEEGAQSLEVLIPYRFKVNKGSKSMMAFNYNYIKTLLFHSRKLLSLQFQKLRLPSESVETKINSLRIIAQKARIMRFINYSKMKTNFRNITKLEEQNIKHSHAENGTSSKSEQPRSLHNIINI